MNELKDKTGLILIDKNDNIVLQLRDNNLKIKYPNCVGTFGGAIEQGESPEQAIIREIKEELDYNLKNFEFIGNFPFEGYNIFMFLKRDSNLESSKLKINEGQRVVLINLNNPQLKNYTFAFNTKKIVEHYLSNI